MQELRLVAVSEDGSYLVLATAGRGTRFTLPIDDRLRAVVRGHFSRLGQYEIEVESPLRPKEIQARIRAGETAEEIAETAGIPVERVRWFEGPVLQEREYMAQQAQRVPIRRPGESSPAPALGELVEERLGRRGIDLEEVEWDSRKCEDSTWRVSLAFYYDGRPYSAEWAYDPRRRHISAVNDEASRLSSLDVDESADDTVTPFVPRRPMKIVGDPVREQAPPPGPVIPVPAPARREEFVAEEPTVVREVPRPAPAEEPVARAPRPREAHPEIVAKPQELTVPTRPAPPAAAEPPAPAPQPSRPEPVAPPAAERAPVEAAPVEAARVETAPMEVEAEQPEPEPEREVAEAKPQAPKPAPPKQAAAKPAAAAAKPAAAQKPAQARPAAQKPSQARPAAQKPAPQKPVEKPAEKAPERPAAAAAKPATPPAAPEKRPPARKRARSKRASVPSWDEIMFGARRPE
ncbi:septation protein SepH [Actinoallomurus sp. CA-150999]|uniref:septation protein SepH n=1 Tax=Actinoallomurus sp. CA-150999 TaxID=3239887 RepID=UPI003D935DB7